MADAISGNNSTSMMTSALCEVFCDNEAQQDASRRRRRHRHVKHGSNQCRSNG
jgi:hypothetical protein